MGAPHLDAELRAVVLAHEPTSPREEAAKARFLVELDRLDVPCDEHAEPTHVTASAVVIGPRGTALHLHKRLGRWMQPGGHIDPGETPPTAATREATEELGLAVEHVEGGPHLIHLDVHAAALGHTHLDLRYVLRGEDRDPQPPPGESPQARWFGWDEAMATADEALVGAVDVGARPLGRAGMSEALDRLLAVGDLDTTITQLAHRRAGLVEKAGLTAVEAQVGTLSAATAEVTARRAELEATQKDLEVQIATVTERRESLEQRMYTATGSSTRDLQAMSEEVRHLGQRRAELEEHELVAMVEQEPIDAELAALAARLAPLEEQAVRLRAEVAEAATEIDAELAVVTERRAAEAAQLPSALAERYETLRQRLKGGVGVARLIGQHCDGCHLSLSSVEVERIRHQAPDAVVTCEQCGRILVPT